MGQRPFVLTSFSVGEGYRRELDGMLSSFSKYHMGVPVVVGLDVVPVEWGWRRITCYKATWLRDVYRSWASTHNVLWVDADARFRRRVAIPGGDYLIAAKTYNHLSTGTMVLRRDIDALLDKWVELSDGADHDEESFIGACKALEIVPRELPDEMTSPCSEHIYGWDGKLWHNSAIVHWNRARKTLGYIEDWPPSEEERELASP